MVQSRRKKKGYVASTPEIRQIFPKNKAQEKLLRSIENNSVTFVDGCAGTGKLQPDYSEVLTPSGYERIDSLKVGDYVIGRNGKPTEVLNIYPKDNLDIWEVEFSDGVKTRCCDEHLWAVRPSSEKEDNNPFVIQELKQLIPSIEKQEGYYEIPIVEPIQFEEKELPISPYQFGLNLEEGIDVPTDYLYSSVNQRLELLQGLMDVNGIVNEEGDIVFINKNVVIAKIVVHLVQTLGGLARLEKVATKYLVYVHLEKHNPFKLSLFKTKYSFIEKVQRKIVSVSYIGKESGRCIHVKDKEHLYLTNDCIVTHNTLMSIYSAITSLERNEIDKILYIKPNVDMHGERGVGFLKGELDEKLAPLLQPVVDNLQVFLCPNKAKYYIDKNIIDIGLLEYLRGRNLDRTFVIFDEAQNTTPHGLITVITRLTDTSKLVVLGDVMQCDTQNINNGLNDAFKRYKGLSGIGFVKFTENDILRNSFMKSILIRYNRTTV